MKKITDYTNENNEKVLNVIKERICINENDDFPGEYVVFVAYMMYKLITDWKGKSEEEFYALLSDEHFNILHNKVRDELDKRINWDEFIKITESFTEDELVSFIMTYQDSTYNSDPTQFCILELIDKILNIKKDDNVIEYSSVDSEFTYYSLQKHPSNYYTSYVASDIMQDASHVKMNLLNIDGTVVWDDDFSDLMMGGDLPDKVFVNYIINWREYKHCDELNKMLHTVWSEYTRKFSNPICLAGIISAVLNEKGRAVMFVNAGHLSGGESEEARRILVESKNVKGVIAL
ncbi:MAG: hypothetical protein K5659_04750, partial [Lachnospiraceae bacterium]|nr:hypothetical protein [Lachnospiraceae bacterium]